MSNCIFTQSHIPSRDIELLIQFAVSMFFIWFYFVSKLNNKSKKEAEFVFGSVSFCSLLFARSHHNQTNEEWTENDAHLFTNIVEMKFSIRITRRKRINFSIAYVRVVLICFVSLRFFFIFIVVFESLSLFLSLFLCHMVVFVSIVGIQITTIFNTIPELECFWYVYLVVLSCVLKRKSSIFRFVVIGIVNGGL